MNLEQAKKKYARKLGTIEGGDNISTNVVRASEKWKEAMSKIK